MAIAMASRMKLNFQFQRRKTAQDERAPQFQSAQIQLEELSSSSEEQDQYRRASIREANDFIHDVINLEDRWSSHMPLIRINCPYTLSELHALGNLPQPEGVVACHKLIRVPVIHEEISVFIWTQLAKLARGPNFADDPVSKSEDSIYKQQTEGPFLAQLDERFRFDKPASMSARGRRRESPPVSPKDVQPWNFTRSSSSLEQGRRSRSTQACHVCRHESIDEGNEELGDNRSEAAAAMRGKVVSPSTKGQPASRPVIERQRSFFSSRDSSHVPLLKWSRERGTPNAPSRASSTTRTRSGSLAGRLGSAVGGLGYRVAGALGDGIHPPRSRSRSARSL